MNSSVPPLLTVAVPLKPPGSTTASPPDDTTSAPPLETAETAGDPAGGDDRGAAAVDRKPAGDGTRADDHHVAEQNVAAAEHAARQDQELHRRV